MNMMKVGEVLHQERIKRHMSMQTVSRELAMRLAKVGEIEVGLKNPSDEELKKFSIFYGVDYEKLKTARDKGVYEP